MGSHSDKYDWIKVKAGLVQTIVSLARVDRCRWGEGRMKVRRGMEAAAFYHRRNVCPAPWKSIPLVASPKLLSNKLTATGAVAPANLIAGAHMGRISMSARPRFH